MTNYKTLIHTLFILAVALPLTAHAKKPATFSDAPEALDLVSTLPLIKVEGNHFVNENGETVIFRGVALPDPVHLKNKGHWNKAYFKAIKDWHANVVRIPVHPETWRETGMENFMCLVDQGIRWAQELDLYVIIDWHTISNPINSIPHRLLYRTTREETFYFWYLTASRYRNNTTVVCYELYNEPTNSNERMGKMPWSEYKAYIEDLIYMIYHIDETAIPLVAGFDWGYDLSYIRDAPIDYPGVAYSTHPYPQKRNPPWEEQWEKDWGFAAQKYPMIATEFGFMSEDERGAHNPVLGDETYGEAIIDFFEERGISWTPWVFDPEWPPRLIEDWNYTPTRQGRFFRDKMLQKNP
jgi:endoglucanase